MTDNLPCSTDRLQIICEKYRIVPSDTNYNIILNECCSNGRFIEEDLLVRADNIRLNDKRRKRNNIKLISTIINQAHLTLNGANLIYGEDYKICIVSVSNTKDITYVDIIIKAKGNKSAISILRENGWEIESTTYIDTSISIPAAIQTKKRASKGDIKVLILKYKIDDILYCY